MDINEFSISNGDVIAIPEEDAIYITDKDIEVLGYRPFFYFKNGEIKEYILDQNNNTKKI